jgi:hypothetical protein
LDSTEWLRLQALLVEFMALCSAHEATPVVLIIPTKEQVYADLMEPEGKAYERMAALHAADRLSFQRHVLDFCDGRGLAVIDLTPPYLLVSRDLPLLYWQFDTHWTEHGRRLAAQAIADWIHVQE